MDIRGTLESLVDKNKSLIKDIAVGVLAAGIWYGGMYVAGRVAAEQTLDNRVYSRQHLKELKKNCSDEFMKHPLVVGECSMIGSYTFTEQ